MPENNGNAPGQEKSVGTILREAREARNLSLEQVARATRIHAHVLRALEGDDTAKLGAVYTKSFLKIYAEFLGLDKEDLVARFVAAIPEAAAPVRKTSPVRRGQAPAAMGPVLRVSGRIGRRLWAQVCRSIERIPWPRVFVIALAVLFVWGMGRMIKGCRAGRRARRAAVTATAPKAAVAKKAAASPAAVKPAADKKDAKKVALVVRAVGRTFLQVKTDDKIVFENILAKGSSESWTADEKIDLWIGDAGALELEVNGRFLDRIGRPGQTLKEVVITPKGLVVRG
ncbi:MAG: helix-turn-helix domain-containing protein [Deltaproteobacteria bacterium]